MEVWKNKINYEGLYQVSNLGRVKSNPRNGTIKEVRILKPQKQQNGYLFVRLYKNGKAKKYLIHRLVAEAFIENPNNLPEVNHKNEDKTCNEDWNLEWCDNPYNINYGNRNKRVREKLSKKVNQYDLEDNFIKTWDCIRDAEGELKIHNSSISACCKGKRKTAGSYIWKYKEEEDLK